MRRRRNWSQERAIRIWLTEAFCESVRVLCDDAGRGSRRRFRNANSTLKALTGGLEFQMNEVDEERKPTHRASLTSNTVG